MQVLITQLNLRSAEFPGLSADKGIDLGALVDCGVWITTQIGHDSRSRVGQAVRAKHS